MRTYPLSIPQGIESYVSNSVQARCDQAITNAFINTPEQIRRAKDQHIYTELNALRDAVAGKHNSTDSWITWGYRTVVKAWQDAETLAQFREALASEHFSYITSGHKVSPNSYHVYAHDPKSPSGSMLIASAAKDLPGISEVMKGHTTCAGGERGEMASRAMIRG